jgi:hypothetical protein
MGRGLMVPPLYVALSKGFPLCHGIKRLATNRTLLSIGTLCIYYTDGGGWGLNSPLGDDGC